MLLLPEDATGENDHGDTVTTKLFFLSSTIMVDRGKWRYLKGNYYYWRYTHFPLNPWFIGRKGYSDHIRKILPLAVVASSLFPPPHCDRQWQGLNIRPGANSKWSKNYPGPWKLTARFAPGNGWLGIPIQSVSFLGDLFAYFSGTFLLSVSPTLGSWELDSAKDSTRFLINSRAHRACWSA